MLALVATPGCKSEPHSLSFTGATDYRDAKVTVRGRTVPMDATGFVKFGAGEIAENDPVTIEYATPCGTDTVTVTPTRPANESGVIKLELPPPKNLVRLLFDPGLAGKEIERPRATIPPPKDERSQPGFVAVAFGDCPRTIKVDGREVKIPDGGGKSVHYVLVAADKDACYLSGLALYGEAKGSCKPERSEKLTGQDAYAISQPATFLFEPLSDKELARAGGCTNREYLQRCE